MAIELIRIASLSMPLALDEVLDLGWSKAIKARLPEPEKIELPILLCSVFPLYVTKVGLEGKSMWRFVIPPVCLETITADEKWLPFIQAVEGFDQAKYLQLWQDV